MKIYSSLRMIWLSLLVGALTSLAVPFDNDAVLMAASLVSLAAYAAAAYALSRIAAVSPRMGRAFVYQLVSLVLRALSLVCSLFAGDPAGMLSIFSTLLSLAGGLSALLAEYQLYWALDERILPCGYAFPARRIRWCFYAPLLGALASSMLGVALTFALYLPAAVDAAADIPLAPAMWVMAGGELLTQTVVLVLLGQYLRAVKAREDDPLAT